MELAVHRRFPTGDCISIRQCVFVARNKSSIGGRSLKRGQSVGRQAAGLCTQPSGLLLSLDIESMSSDLGADGKTGQMASKSKQEALLQTLEQKMWLNMEELAVRFQHHVMPLGRCDLVYIMTMYNGVWN